MPTIVHRERHRFDIVGLLTVSPGWPVSTDWPRCRARPVRERGRRRADRLGAVFLAAFGVHAARRHEGRSSTSGAAHPSFAAAAGVFLLAGLSLYGPLLLLGLYYQDVQGKSALITGLLLAPQASARSPRTVAAGSDRVGPRLVVVTGLVLTVAGTWPSRWPAPHPRIGCCRHP